MTATLSSPCCPVYGRVYFICGGLIRALILVAHPAKATAFAVRTLGGCRAFLALLLRCGLLALLRLRTRLRGNLLTLLLTPAALAFLPLALGTLALPLRTCARGSVRALLPLPLALLAFPAITAPVARRLR